MTPPGAHTSSPHPRRVRRGPFIAPLLEAVSTYGRFDGRAASSRVICTEQILRNRTAILRTGLYRVCNSHIGTKNVYDVQAHFGVFPLCPVSRKLSPQLATYPSMS